MSNREQLRERKLSHHQKPIWRKAFEASMLHTSIEAAEKKAWQAVDIWERVGAFNESQMPSEPRSNADEEKSYRDAFGMLRVWFGTMPGSVELNEMQTDKLYQTVKAFDDGEIDIEDFKADLESIYPTV